MRSLLVVALAAATHYEKPPCGSDEVEGQIGQGGIACLPACDMSTSCPTDVPSGVTAKPECALQDASSSKMYCGLICHEDSQCGDQSGTYEGGWVGWLERRCIFGLAPAALVCAIVKHRKTVKKICEF